MNFKQFMKENKKVKADVQYTATKSLLDENGVPLKWAIRALTTKENDSIRDECMMDIPVKGKGGMYRPKLDTSKYIAKMMCAAIVAPDLHSKELQDSYSVMTAEELLKEMVDNPGEYSDFANFVQAHCGFSTLSDLVEEAKN